MGDDGRLCVPAKRHISNSRPTPQPHIESRLELVTIGIPQAKTPGIPSRDFGSDRHRNKGLGQVNLGSVGKQNLLVPQILRFKVRSLIDTAQLWPSNV